MSKERAEQRREESMMLNFMNFKALASRRVGPPSLKCIEQSSKLEISAAANVPDFILRIAPDRTLLSPPLLESLVCYDLQQRK